MVRTLLALLLLVGRSALGAQWQLAVRHVTATSHGDAQADLDPAHPDLQAHRPGTWTFAVARDAGAWRIGLDAHHTTADLAEVGTASTVITSDLLAAWGAGLELARRIAGRPGVTSLLIGAGVIADRWTFDVEESSPRTRVAARGVAETDFPIGRRWEAVVRGEVTIGPSVFRAEELPDGFTTRQATRLGLALGVARRW